VLPVDLVAAAATAGDVGAETLHTAAATDAV